jgi:hypothetical protein
MLDPMVEPTVELVMSEFGSTRQNAGGAQFDSGNRLNPTLDSFRRIFPQAKVTLYSDQHLDAGDGVEVVRVDSPFSRTEQRYGWRSHDYYQAVGLLKSSADITIAMDSDMKIVSDGFRAIARFAEIFGLAVPLNPRLLLKIDGGIGVDSTYVAPADDTLGLGLTYNLTPIAFSTRHENARAMLERYSQLLRQSPGRGAVHLVQASYELGYQPFVLPPQWCVCSPRDLDSKHLWREAVVLHVGHLDVLPRWRREMLKQKVRRLVGKVRGR